MTARKPPEKTWESFVEEQIRQAQEAGEFDDLPGFGRPLPALDEPLDENWWIKGKLKRENLAALPPALAIRVEVHRTRERIWRLASEAAVRSEVEKLNEKIRQANFAATWGPPSTTLPLDAEEVLAEWRRRSDATRHRPA